MVWLRKGVVGLGLLFAFVGETNGFGNLERRLPNGDRTVGGRTIGHTPGIPRLDAFSRDMDSSISNRRWTLALCIKDSDNDGRTNGEELGDPNCIWKEGDTPLSAAISNPGIADSAPRGFIPADGPGSAPTPGNPAPTPGNPAPTPGNPAPTPLAPSPTSRPTPVNSPVQAPVDQGTENESESTSSSSILEKMSEWGTNPAVIGAGGSIVGLGLIASVAAYSRNRNSRFVASVNTLPRARNHGGQGNPGSLGVRKGYGGSSGPVATTINPSHKHGRTKDRDRRDYTAKNETRRQHHERNDHRTKTRGGKDYNGRTGHSRTGRSQNRHGRTGRRLNSPTAMHTPVIGGFY